MRPVQQRQRKRSTAFHCNFPKSEEIARNGACGEMTPFLRGSPTPRVSRTEQMFNSVKTRHQPQKTRPFGLVWVGNCWLADKCILKSSSRKERLEYGGIVCGLGRLPVLSPPGVPKPQKGTRRGSREQWAHALALLSAPASDSSGSTGPQEHTWCGQQ